jgi:hypothetical protein
LEFDFGGVDEGEKGKLETRRQKGEKGETRNQKLETRRQKWRKAKLEIRN